MKNALNALINNGLSPALLLEVLDDLIENDDFEDVDDCIGCVAQRSQMAETASMRYVEWSVDNPLFAPNVVTLEGGDYLVLTDDEAAAALAEHIESSAWAFNASFLSGATGMDEDIFTGLVDKCEDSNDAVLALIKGSCGLVHFIEEAEASDGRGSFLATYDGEECEQGDYYIYRVA